MLDEDAEDDEEENIFHDVDDPEISLQALTGWDSPKILRSEIEINRQHLVALIYSVATHNFINERIVNHLNLKITHTKSFTVRVVDGHPLQCGGAYRDVTMRIGGAIFQTHFYALPLSVLTLFLAFNGWKNWVPLLVIGRPKRWDSVGPKVW